MHEVKTSIKNQSIKSMWRRHEYTIEVTFLTLKGTVQNKLLHLRPREDTQDKLKGLKKKSYYIAINITCFLPLFCQLSTVVLSAYYRGSVSFLP